MYIHIDWMLVYKGSRSYSTKLSHIANCQFAAILRGE